MDRDMRVAGVGFSNMGNLDIAPVGASVVKPSGIGNRPENHEPKVSSTDIPGTPKRDIKHSAQTLNEVQGAGNDLLRPISMSHRIYDALEVI